MDYKEALRRRTAEENLYRDLWQYAYEHGGLHNGEECYMLFMTSEEKLVACYKTSEYYIRDLGAITFANKEDAKNAISNIVEPWLQENPWYIELREEATK